jgi:hypothetical protein
MEAGKIWARKYDVGDGAAASWQEIDDAGRQACLHVELHQHVVGVDGVRCRLPDDDIAHHRWSGRKVCRNRGEIEGGYRIDKPFKRAIRRAVPFAFCIIRLLIVDLLHVPWIEAQKIR